MSIQKSISKFLIIAGVVAAVITHNTWAKEEHGKGHGAHWSYDGATGPEHWGEFSETCKIGKSQSPIDFKGPFSGETSSLKVSYKKSVLKVLNNGHTIQVNYDAGSYITVGDKKYELLQFHFHRPSEEKINGKSKAMVAHFVHKSADGKLAVIGVLLDKGQENALIKTIWANFPKEENKELVNKGVEIDAASFLPKDPGYYHFTGSLTTPPCTEGVEFFILKNIQQVSAGQVEAFPFKHNARPTQPLNGRTVFESK